jgi:hypothetical protein
MSRGAKSKMAAAPSIQREWLRRVEAEYRSATVAHHLTLWLMQMGASPDLVRAGLRIAGDEMKHSEMSHRAYVAAGGVEAPRIPRETLGLRTTGEPLEHDVTRTGVEVFCLGETVAVPLFKTMREGCSVPPARRTLDRVLRDEVRHRDFGWSLLGWLLELTVAPALRAIVVRELPTYFARVRRNYGAGALPTPEVTDEERAWGLIRVTRYTEIVHRTLERDWVPRFARHGIDAKTAWTGATAMLAGEVPR